MTTPRRIAIVMSRLPRLISPQAVWLRALRAALRHVQRLGASLLVVEGTAGADFVRRGAERLALNVEVLAVSEKDLASSEASDAPVPEQDQILTMSADMIMVLSVKANGNTHRLLRARLSEGRRVIVVDLPWLQTSPVREELIGLGATLWTPPAEQQRPLRDMTVEFIRDAETNRTCEIVPIPAGSDWTYLSHTTRSCPGPWPRQTRTEYLDSLLDDSEDADHSALATLLRIIRLRLLQASSRLIRGGFPVVCLTQIPLPDLPRMRRFRPHQARWDFEPFGLCINRQWLHERGARPVVYGPDSTWEQLAEADRPYFQRSSRPEVLDRSSAMDWSIEQEWRHPGDLDLQDLPGNCAMVFVPDFKSARQISRISPWPVTLWPNE